MQFGKIFTLQVAMKKNVIAYSAYFRVHKQLSAKYFYIDLLLFLGTYYISQEFISQYC